MKYDFETVLDRSQTGSMKWEKYAGKEVLPLWVADMDFSVAPEIQEALLARVKQGVYGYTVPYEEVQQAVIDYQQRVHGVTIEPEWIVWSPGMVQSLYLTACAFAEPDDEIMTLTPIYPPFIHAPTFGGRKTIQVLLQEYEGHWTIDFDALEQAVTPKTKVFLFCNPHNPIGRVYRPEEIEQILSFCERHNLILCSDEIHCDLILDDDLTHHTALRYSERISSYGFTMMSHSKTYNTPGLACAYAIIPSPTLRARFKRAARGVITEINCMGYASCVAAYTYGEPWRKELIQTLRGNRKRLSDCIAPYASLIRLTHMEATYLAWLDVRSMQLDNPAAHFESAGLGFSDGRDFGLPGFVRMNLGAPAPVIDQALNRLDLALSNHRLS